MLNKAEAPRRHTECLVSPAAMAAANGSAPWRPSGLARSRSRPCVLPGHRMRLRRKGLISHRATSDGRGLAGGVSGGAAAPAGSEDSPSNEAYQGSLLHDDSTDDYRCMVPCVHDTEEMLPPPKKPEKLFKMLGLDAMSEEEMEASFNAIDKDGNGVLTIDEIEVLVRERLCKDSCLPEVHERKVARFMQRFDSDKDGQVTHEEFSSTIHDLANTIDRRVYIVAACMGAVGLGTGVLIPVLPEVVEQLGLSVQDMGFATSAKGAAQMVANFPGALAVGMFGRVPLLAGGLLLMGLGAAGLTAVAGAVSLATARALSGAAASIFHTSATAYIVDISNPLNRARSMANAFVLLSLGLMLGPMVGGVVSSALGVQGAIFVAASIFAAMAAIALVTVPETLSTEGPPPLVARDPSTKGTGPGVWFDLLRRPGILDMVVTNFLSNAVQAGAQFTLLPVLLTTNLGLSPATVGSVFAAMAATGVIGTRFVANLSDRIGGKWLIAPGSLLKAVALLLIPLVADLTSLVLPLALVLATGNTLSQSAPRNFISINSPREIRVQALAMLNTAGDLGFLIGGIVAGTAAKLTSIPTAIGAAGALMLVLAVVFQARLYSNTKPSDQQTDGTISLGAAA